LWTMLYFVILANRFKGQNSRVVGHEYATSLGLRYILARVGVIEAENNPDLYHKEDRKENRGHKHEKKD